jgi:hypothetical protein
MARLDIGGDADPRSGKYAAQERRWAARAQGPTAGSAGRRIPCLLLRGRNREDRGVRDVKQTLRDAAEEKTLNGAQPSSADDDQIRA